MASLEEYWSEYQMLQGHINLIVSPVYEAHKEYYEILRKYKIKEYELGKREATRLVNRAGVRYAFKEAMSMPISGFIKKDSDKLFGTLPKAEQDLLDRTYKASENTLKRVDSQLNKIITDGYRSGKGINDISNQVTKRFDQLASWEAKRIARTEVNTSHNKATVDTYNDLGVEYTQWIAASDDRTRDSHVEVDGEIIPMGGTYSNGLQYPGDMSGPIEEWINCRCSNAPFVIPYGYMAPSFSPFREEDLVPIENVRTADELLQPTEPTMVVPTDEQLKANLTKEELKLVEWARGVQESKFIKAEGKAKARQQLEELYQKALNKKPLPKPEKVPKQEVKVEPLKPKTKTVEEQPVKPKTVSAEQNINRMSSQELYESMTKADKKKYDKAKTTYENGKKYEFKPLIEKGLLEMRKLEQKQRDKLLKRTKPKQKPKPNPYTRDLDNIHKDINVPTEELIPKLEKWIDKRCKNTIEYGYHFDVKTGKIVGEEIRGKKGGVSISDKGSKYGSIHSHTTNGMSPPSAEDLITFRCKEEKDHFMPSKYELWYVEATDSFGPLGKLSQIDLQEAHAECVARGKEQVAKDIKQGKISADETEIAMALDKYVGDELLKTFNSPPWNKTLTVKRYYR